MSTKTHTAQLADRYEIQGRLYVRVRAGNGPTIEIQVPDALRAEAAAIYGGGQVCYQYRGGRAFLVTA